jgi:TonB family protein
MTSGDERPRVLIQPDVLAYYPPRLRDQYVEGVVRVGVRINPGGCVIAVMIRQSSGATELDHAGMRLVFDMQFTPPEFEGGPVGSAFILPVRFSMTPVAPAQP